MKIMAIVDRHGLPLSVRTHAANHHEVRLVQLCFDFYMIEAKPENLIGDRAYDSDPLDHALRQNGIEMIAPHRSNRTKPPEEDNEAGELNEAKEVLWMIFPSDEDPTLPLDPGEEAFDQPAPQEASQAAPVLRRRLRSVRAVRRDHLDAILT